jgi:YidC/Oxa1 family membrane protein insertase
MQMDRNSVIGFVLLALLFFGYFYFTRQAQLQYEVRQQAVKDSLARLEPVRRDSPRAADSAVTGSLVQHGTAREETLTVETDVLRIRFSNRGGQPRRVELLRYLARDSTPVRLLDTAFDRFSYAIRSGGSTPSQSADLYFAPGVVSRNPDGSQTVRYTLSDSSGRSVTHRFTVRPSDYMVDFVIEAEGADRLFDRNQVDFLWQLRARQQERDIQSEKLETQLGVMQADGYDYHTLGSGISEKMEEGARWIGFKQKFFNTTIVPKDGFTYAEASSTVPDDSTHLVANSVLQLRATIPAGTKASIPLRVYYGPNEYAVLKSYGIGLEDLVNLGQGFYAFVKHINRWIILPFFSLIERSIASYGLVIALLTIFIRLLTSPLVYTSYLSGAKMKALRPEIDALRQKLGEDQQAFSMEQMKLFRSAGVNPLGGCIPALLQIPIFFALYSFFNANISLRGQSFWWSEDLSAYDSIVTWGFSIPFIGNHLSLFTILSVATSLLISLYSMSMTPDQGNPVLKYMPYIFPVMLLGIFNSLPSALTWYYTVSNVITLAMQFVIQNYIIDHDKVLAGIEENRRKPRKKSMWQERLEQMQETQKRAEKLQSKGPRKS